MVKRYKVVNSYITVTKVNNTITIADDYGLNEAYRFKGTIEAFMKDTFMSYEVASLQP